MLSDKLLKWYDENRRVLPFRGTRDPYRVWVSEIMLQQTRTETVAPYYERFIAHFPDVFSLAAASEGDVLKLWEGLGYYTRARNMMKAAKEIVSSHHGVFPADESALRALPGIGAYTASAIASIAFDKPCPAIDGNLTRVLTRVFGVREDVGIPSVRREIAAIAKREMPPARCGEFNQALMDLGATICKPGTPDCDLCPLAAFCDALREGDADCLPVMSKKAPPRVISLSVTLVTKGGRVFMRKRKEALLNGLYVFLLEEDHPSIHGAKALSEARHVFTHRIWQMKIYHAEAPEDFNPDGIWASRRDILSLPLPTAVRAAKEEAIRLLTPAFLPIGDENILEAARVYAHSWQAAHKHHSAPDFVAEHTPVFFKKELWTHIQNGQRAYAITLRGRVAGILVFDDKAGEINHLYIDPACQGAGLGRDAMEFALAHMVALPRITVDVLTNNIRAQALYAAYGFRMTGNITILNEETGLSETVMIRENDAAQHPKHA